MGRALVVEHPPQLQARGLNGWQAAALGVLSGVVQAASFPPANVWWVAFAAQAPLFIALRGRSRQVSAGLGGLCGITTVAACLFWIPEVIVTFTGANGDVSLGATIAVGMYTAARPALVCAFVAGASRRGWPAALSYWLAQLSAEALVPLPLPWCSGAALSAHPIFLQVADLAGPTAVSALVVSANLALASIQHRRDRLWCGVHSAVMLAGLGYGVLRKAQVEAWPSEGPESRVGLVQGNVSPEASADSTQVLFGLVALSETLLADERADLIVWSEGVVEVAGGQIMAPPLGRVMARKLRVPVLFGARLMMGDGRRNTALLVGTDGKSCAKCRYDKERLFPFGEYLPFEAVVPQLRKWMPRAGRVTAGDGAEPIPFGPHHIGMTICYESIFSGLVRDRASRADLLVNLTNDIWFAGTPAIEWHFALTRLKAIEQRRYLVIASNSGLSGVVDPVGHLVLAVPAGARATGQATVKWFTQRTVYAFIGDAFWWATGVFILLAQAWSPARIRSRLK